MQWLSVGMSSRFSFLVSLLSSSYPSLASPFLHPLKKFKVDRYSTKTCIYEKYYECGIDIANLYV